MEGFPTFKGS